MKGDLLLIIDMQNVYDKAAATQVVLSGLAPLHVKLMSTDEYLAESNQ